MPSIRDVPVNELVDLSSKVAICVDNGLFIEIARQLAKSFKKVYYYMPWKNGFPKSNQYVVGEGIEGVERIYDFWDYKDKADIFIFPDIYDADMQLELLRQGKLVWGSRKGENMELYREQMKEYMKSKGLYVSPYKVVKGLDNLRSYLKEHDDVWVKQNVTRGDFETANSLNYKTFEPVLDEWEHKLGKVKHIKKFIVEKGVKAVETGMDCYTIDGKYPDKTLAGIEVKDLGYVGRIVEYNKLSTKITDFNDKVSSLFNMYGYRGFFSTEIRISEEHPPYMVDFCFSEDTEILTNKGWKFIKDIVVGDTVATMDASTREIQYQDPTDFIVNDYSGKMIELTNPKKSIECLVTPNHLVLRTDRYKKKIFKEKADSLTDKGFIPRTGIWKGSEEKYFTLPEYHKEWTWTKTDQKCFNRNTKEIFTSDREPYDICTKVKHEKAEKIKIGDWAEFLGWYLSEGSTSSKYVTQITQFKFPEKVKKVLDKLPFKYNYDGKAFRISSVQLTTYLKDFGLCNKKFIPDYIKNSNPKTIRKFLDAFNWGDGSRHKGNKVYFTTSKTLSDDLQELLFKVGSVANIVFKKTKGTIAKIAGKDYIRNHNSYTLYEHTSFKDYWFETKQRKDRYIKEVDYSGKVYCVTVPNGTVYVRRNGKPFWSSNCARAGSPPNELYQLMYKNLPEIIWYGANGYVIDPETEHEYGVEALIHSSWADQNWQAIDFPEEYRDNIKLRNVCYIDGRYYAVPQSVGLPEIGAIVAEGDTMDEAIEKVKEIAESIQGHYIEVKIESIDVALKQFEELEKMGVKII